MCITPPQTSNCDLEPSLPAGGSLGPQGSPHSEVVLRLPVLWQPTTHDHHAGHASGYFTSSFATWLRTTARNCMSQPGWTHTQGEFPEHCFCFINNRNSSCLAFLILQLTSHLQFEKPCPSGVHLVALLYAVMKRQRPPKTGANLGHTDAISYQSCKNPEVWQHNLLGRPLGKPRGGARQLVRSQPRCPGHVFQNQEVSLKFPLQMNYLRRLKMAVT